MMSQAGGMDMNAVMQRLRRLAMLDTSVFSEVKSDTTATVPALLIAIGATLLSGIGGWLWYLFQDFHPKAGQFFLKSVIIGSILSIILWAVWIAVTYVMLTQIFRARADLNELVRVFGFAAAPLALGLLMLIPGLDYGIGLTALILMFGATLVAVQSVTDADAGKTLLSTAAGFAVWAIVLQLFVAGNYYYSSYAPGIFIFAPR